MSDLRRRLDALPPDKRKLLELLVQHKAEHDQPPAPPHPSSAPTTFPLSFAQQRLWFLDQLEPCTPLYNLPVAMRLRGPLDLAALRRSFDQIARRHAIIRARFAMIEHQPVQMIAASLRVALPVVSLLALPVDRRERAAQSLVNAAARVPFDLARGPLLRTLVLRLAEQDHVLLVTMHHIISDGWSGGVLLRELMALYTAVVAGLPAPLPPPPMQYTDYVLSQREQTQAAALERQLAYWRRVLAGVAVLQLPTDHARPHAATAQTASRAFALTPTLTGALKQLSQRANTTLFMTLLAGFAALLARYSRQDDICIGSLVANRNRAEIEGLIGFFVNTLALRIDLSGEPTVASLLRRVREVTLGAYDHQDVPIEQVIEALQPERRMSHTPLFQVMCTLQNFPLPQQTLATLRLSPFRAESRYSGFDLTLWLREEDGQLAGELEYRPDLFDHSTILLMVRHLRALAQGMAAAPAGRVIDLPLLTHTERHQLLVEWNDSAADLPPASFPRLFAPQLARCPDAIAIVCGAEHLSYHELHRRAERLSGVLQEHGIGPEALVAVFAERGVAFLIAMLAVFEAGAAYVPLDPSYPADRLDYMLRDSGARVLLTSSLDDRRWTIDDTPQSSNTIVYRLSSIVNIGADWPQVARSPNTPPQSGAMPDSLAYVLYTSGSTGVPKGAMVEQRGMCNHLQAKIADLGLTAADRIAQTASQCFDISVWQFLAGLVVGGQVHVIADAIALDPPRLLEHIARARISILETVPSLVQALLDERATSAELADLRWLIPTGEALASELCRRWLRRYPAIPLLNAYGPTECSDDVAHYAIAQPLPLKAGTTPIGRAVANMRLYVLGPRLQPVPIGCVGELYVEGAGVGRGYLGRPDLTAARFIPNPFARVLDVGYRVSEDAASNTRHPIPDTRLYKTGDLVRSSANGLITFIGRIDGQIKLRGFRIELGEVEAMLARHPAVRQAVVLAREIGPGDTRLVAYVVPTNDERRRAKDERPSTEDRRLKIEDSNRDAQETLSSILYPLSSELRSFLVDRLPAYMLPGAFVLLDALPLMPSGKVDRRALPDPTSAAFADTFVAPRTPIEQALARLWAEVLRLERVGVEDNFFALGGHSLLATQVVARVRGVFEIELPLRALFEAPTVAGLALRIAGAQRAAHDHTPVDSLAERVAPLSFAQQRLWFLDQLQPGLPNYNIAVAMELRGSLDVAALEWSFNELVRRHAVLRTTFAMVGEQPAQLVAGALAVPLALTDLRDHDQPARMTEVQRLAAAEAQHAFDLARGPLLHTSLLCMGERAHVLLLNLHHIVADGWSMGVLIRELAALYTAAAAGQPAPLPALPMQYADYAIAQREWLAGADDPHTLARVQSQLAYWRRQLAELPTLALPTDHPRPAVATNRGARCRFHVPRALSEALTARSQAEGVTLFMTLLAAFQIVLARESGQDDIVVGTPIAGRTRRETENLIGFFVNTLVMRTDLRGNPTPRELLGRVRAISLDAFAHQDLPFDLLVEALQPARELNRAPLFQVLFVLQNAPLVLDMPGLRLRMIDVEPETAKFDMTLSVMETPQALSCVWEYATDLFEAPRIKRMCAYFQALLVGFAAGPDQRLADLIGAADASWREYMRLEFDLAGAPLFADEAQAIELLDRRLLASHRADAQPAPPDSATRVAPLSFVQERLWFLDQLQPGSPGYPISAAVRMSGELRIAALQSSLAALIQRHEILRTTFALAHGRPVQMIAPATALRWLPLRLIDLSGLEAEHTSIIERLAGAAAQHPFDLNAGPLLRATLLRLGPRAHALLLTLHQIVADHWSIGVAMTELAALYDAFVRQQSALLLALPLQYADYAIAQRTRLSEQVREAQLDYWRDALGGAPLLLELPFDRPRPPIQRQRGAAQSLLLPATLGAALAALADREASTLFETLLAAFVLLLYRYTGQKDIVVGTPIAGRMPRELEPLIGRFSTMLALRTRLSDDLSFAALLKHARDISREAHAHQELPFELLIEALQPTHDFSRAPIFQVLFEVQSPPPRVALPDLAMRLMPIRSEPTPFDLTLKLTETDAGLLATCGYTPDLFDHATITRLLGHFQVLLRCCVARPERRLSELALLTAAERQQMLIEWSDTATGFRDQGSGVSGAASVSWCIHELVEAQAARTPDAIALVFDVTKDERPTTNDQRSRNGTGTGGACPAPTQHLTYHKLNARANQLAHHLRARGVGADTLVGLCAERSPAMVIGILGILKAGGAYVPLDPTHPAERLAFMLEDTQARVILTNDEGRRTNDQRRRPDFRHSSFVNLAADWDAIAQQPDRNPTSVASRENLAYVIYTSGSTGRPKGVMNSHGAIVNRLLWMQAEYGLAADDAVLQKTPFTFDVSVWEFFWPLLVGARLVLARPEGHKDSAYLVGLIGRSRITTLHFVPSMLRVFLEAPGLEACAGVRRIICSGEALPFALQQRCFARLGAQLHNLYGPTEAAVDVTYWACVRDSQRAIVPIGRPIANCRISLLDQRLAPTPIGVHGELYIGGVGLARGYLGRPDLTAASFVPNPFAEVSGVGYQVLGAEPCDTRYPIPDTRLYKTGDLARWLPDGAIEYLGRLDDQVKIRGFRIELGEIEAALARHPAVQACVVVARTDLPGDTRVIAYVVPTNDQRPTTNDDRRLTIDDRSGSKPSSIVHRPSSIVTSLRDYLKQTLPDYMIPPAFVLLDALPRTPNGKLDRRALPAPDLSSAPLETAYVAPRTPLEEVLVDIWAQVLRRERVGIHDNFFALGGHSLLATQVIYRIREAFQVELTLHTLFEAPTIAQLAQALHQPIAEHGPLVAIQPHGDRRPLFCMPPGGGDLLCYDELARQLGPDQPFYALRAVGLDGAAAPHTEVPAMAAYYLDAVRQVQPHGPYLLAGWSLGGVVAFEMAQLLDAQGEAVALLAMIDPSVPPRTPTLQKPDEATLLAGFAQQFGLTPLTELEHQPEAHLHALLAQAQQAGLLPHTLTPAQLRMRLAVFAAHIQALQSYVPRRGPQHITLFQARERMEPEPADPATAWSALAANFTVSTVPGDHYQILRPPYVQALAAQLRACLAMLPEPIDSMAPG